MNPSLWGPTYHPLGYGTVLASLALRLFIIPAFWPKGLSDRKVWRLTSPLCFLYTVTRKGWRSQWKEISTIILYQVQIYRHNHKKFIILLKRCRSIILSFTKFILHHFNTDFLINVKNEWCKTIKSTRWGKYFCDRPLQQIKKCICNNFRLPVHIFN